MVAYVVDVFFPDVRLDFLDSQDTSHKKLVHIDDNATNNVNKRVNQHHSTLPVGGTDDNTARGQRGSIKFNASQSCTNGQLRSIIANSSIVISLFKLMQYCLGSVYAALPPPGPGPGDFVLLRERDGIAPRSTSTSGRSNNKSQSARGRSTDKQHKLSSKCGKKNTIAAVFKGTAQGFGYQRPAWQL